MLALVSTNPSCLLHDRQPTVHPCVLPLTAPTRRVYYYWALQQEKQGYVGKDGSYQPPRWQLREMLIRGMHHLL
jgi:hypothetical protein